MSSLHKLEPEGGWYKTDRPRIEPISEKKANILMKAVLWGASQVSKNQTGTKKIPDVFLLLMQHQHIFWQWLQFASRLMPFGTLERRETELMILRVAWNTRCYYEWGQHISLSKREGILVEDIERVAKGPNAEGWSPRVRAMLTATDELCLNGIVSSATWTNLTEHLDAGKMIELLLLVGAYQMLAGVLNSVGLPLEEEFSG
ncbi:MAG TPA: carboxymuconolactone decarboxylase family protein [Turneriella sp.]|nr:carboxymuconolactone decarboxylase family protein [Turneriella sp.]